MQWDFSLLDDVATYLEFTNIVNNFSFHSSAVKVNYIKVMKLAAA